MLRDTIFAPILQAAAARPRTVDQARGQDRVSFRVDKQDGYLYLLFSRSGETDASIAAAGSYIIKRSLRDGKFVQVKIFLQNDPGCFVRLFPMGNRTQMDVYLFDEPFQRGIILAEPFDLLLTAPFQTIIDFSEGVVDWPLVLPGQGSEGDERLERIVRTLRPRLKLLADVEDGAMDSSGRFVFIKDGMLQQGKGGFNCSGFAKYVVDGFFKPLTGRLTDIAALKERGRDVRGTPESIGYEDSLDPFFGLDWSRNLARTLEAARTGGALPPPEFADVRDVEQFPYLEDVGYPLDNIRMILYILARRDPGHLYFGSLSREASGNIPVLLHHHLAVFFPYVDQRGVFRIVVLERNVETTIDYLKRQFPAEYVHLVRIDSDGDFAPP